MACTAARARRRGTACLRTASRGTAAGRSKPHGGRTPNSGLADRVSDRSAPATQTLRQGSNCYSKFEPYPGQAPTVLGGARAALRRRASGARARRRRRWRHRPVMRTSCGVRPVMCTPRQRWIKLRAASSLGEPPRPVGTCALAGPPYRPCFHCFQHRRHRRALRRGMARAVLVRVGVS